jgi:hypothetical protein
MSKLVTLGGEVAPVLGIRRDLDRHLLDHAQPETLDARQLARVVRQDADRRQAEIWFPIA